MRAALEIRPCIVTLGRKDTWAKVKELKKCEGLFHGIYQYSYTHGDSPMIGGFKAGTVAYPIAVVEINGKLQEVRVEQVEFTDVVKREALAEIGGEDE